MKTSMDTYNRIRQCRRDGNVSQRQVAKELGLSRNTVRKYWDGDSIPWERKPYFRNPTVITDNVKSVIEACLNEDEQHGLRKQRHTARRIFHRLVDEYGFTGSEVAVRKAVHEIRCQRQASGVYIPLCFAPADSMQIDWGEATVIMSEQKTKVNFFCARMCYSCAPFVIAYWHQNKESFLDALTNAFDYFGGVPRNVIFDNARIAVKEGFGAHATTQDEYSQLAAHYSFEPRFCNPASGNEKGLVENLVGYVRRNVCVPLPQVDSLEELNERLREFCVKYLDHKVESRPQNVGTMLTEEHSALFPLPKRTMDISKKGYPIVNRYSTILFETNSYSVPCHCRGKRVMVKAFPNDIEVWMDGECVAQHVRCQGRKQEILELCHYLPILEQKGRAIRYAKPVLNTVPSEFIDWMEAQHMTAKEMVRCLEQCLAVGYQAVMQHKIVNEPEPACKSEIGIIDVDLKLYDKRFGMEGVSL